MQDIAQLTDLELINNIKENNQIDECLTEIIGRHSGIFYNRTNHFFAKNDVKDSKDLIPSKDLSIYSACLKYDENRGAKFSTHLANEVNWACLTAITKNKKDTERNATILDAIESDNYVEPDFGEDSSDKDILRDFSEELIKLEDVRIKRLFHLRYFASKRVIPWRLIALDIGLSMPGCIWLHNQTISKIKQNIRNKHDKLGQRAH